METTHTVSETVLKELVWRIIDAVRPTRIIIFGSAARGPMGQDSELDILVVMPEGTHRRRTAQLLYRQLPAIGAAKDIVVVTEKDVLAYGDEPSLVLHPALREG